MKSRQNGEYDNMDLVNTQNSLESLRWLDSKKIQNSITIRSQSIPIRISIIMFKLHINNMYLMMQMCD